MALMAVDVEWRYGFYSQSSSQVHGLGCICKQEGLKLAAYHLYQ